MTSCLAFDLGGSKLVTGLVSREGTVLWKRRVEWSPKSASDVVQALRAEGRRALLENPHIRPEVIGANIPGLADPANGEWLSASFSGICDVPVAQALSKAFGLPARADNDGQTCAMAERAFGAGRGVDDFLYLTVSNGVGGGIYSRGRLVRGAFSGACEIGHVTVVEGGRECGCGKRGCLEMYAAGPGLSRTYRERTGREADGELLARLARDGDADALFAWRQAGECLGRAIAMAVNVLNPRRVILGGGLSLAFDLFSPSLHKALQANVFAPPNKYLHVLPTPLGYDGALLGAAALAFSNEEE